MEQSVFKFELVISRVSLDDNRIKTARDLQIDAQFYNFIINVSSNNISLEDYRSGGTCEFEAFPELLALEVTIFPIRLILRHENEIIGHAVLNWAREFSEQIGEKMDEIIHCARCTVQCPKNSKIGTMDVLVRMQVLDKYGREEDSEDKNQQLEALLNKGDTIFCGESETSQNDTPLRSPSSARSACSISFSGSISKDSVEKTSDFGDGCCNPKGVAKIRDTLRLDENSLSKSPDSNPRLLDAGQIPKFCEFCKADLSWVPNCVPCPYCGKVASPHDETYNADMNAEQMLQMYSGTCKEDMSSSDSRGMLEKPEEEAVKTRKKKLTKRRKKRSKVVTVGKTRCHSEKQQPNNSKITEFIKSLLPPKKDKHLSCLSGVNKVPPNKGWMWNLMAQSISPNWRPGFLPKPIKEIMTWFLGPSFPADSIPISPYAGHRKLKNKRCADDEEALRNHLEPKPTFIVQKKHDEYAITMRPLKDCEGLEWCANPYLEMKPICVKVTKDPVHVAKRQIRSKLKVLGYTPCSCQLPIKMCACRCFKEKQRIIKIVEKECVRKDIPSCPETFKFSDVKDDESEVDFAVTPPIGLIKPNNGNKPDLAHIATQYEVKDWKLIPKMPISSALSRLKRKHTTDANRMRAALFRCPQNVQPPIIIPITEKPEDNDKKKKGEKGKKGKKGKKK